MAKRFAEKVIRKSQSLQTQLQIVCDIMKHAFSSSDRYNTNINMHLYYTRTTLDSKYGGIETS